MRAPVPDGNENDARQILPGKKRRRCSCDARRVRVTAANVGFVVVSGDVQISGDEACRDSQMPKNLHE